MYALAVHGGAGAWTGPPPEAERAQALRAGLAAALLAGERILKAGGAALDAVEAAVTVLEDDALFNAGRGAALTSEGTVELDAAIMDGARLAAGAVALVRSTRNPVRLARCVLERLPHVFLAGESADRYAAEVGLPLADSDYFITPERREQLAALLARAAEQRNPRGSGSVGSVGTVGAVARDVHGHLAAATSTGGTAGKLPGRIGDSPVIGAGTYADDRSCAVSTTGHGEWFLRTVQAYDIAARLQYAGDTLEHAVEQAVGSRLVQLGAHGGLIAADRGGSIVMRYNTAMMLRASLTQGGAPQIHID